MNVDDEDRKSTEKGLYMVCAICNLQILAKISLLGLSKFDFNLSHDVTQSILKISRVFFTELMLM